MNGASAARHSASFAANTGHAAASSRPIPAHWPPWPGNTNTTRPSPAGGAVPVTTPSPGRPAATAARPAARSPVITARCSNADRAVASDQARWAWSAGSGPGRAAVNSA